MTIIHSPENTFRITAIWAAVSVDEGTGMEGVCAMIVNGMSIPLLAADETRLEWIVAQARMLANASGKRIKIIKLTSRVEVMEIPAFGGTA